MCVCMCVFVCNNNNNYNNNNFICRCSSVDLDEDHLIILGGWGQSLSVGAQMAEEADLRLEIKNYIKQIRISHIR